MKKSQKPRFIHRARTPRAAAIAGILFGILFTICIVLIQLSLPAKFTNMTAWTDTGRDLITAALWLMPFAGLAFLWFIGVIRDRLGAYEDQFFGAVFQGSGLLFLAMTFCAFAIAGGMLAAYRYEAERILTNEIYLVGRSVISEVFNIYALKMAAIFMFSLSTLWLNTGVMPRQVSFITYLMAIGMFFSPNISLWLVLLFPIWVLCVSIYILILTLRQKPSDGADGMTPKPAAM